MKCANARKTAGIWAQARLSGTISPVRNRQACMLEALGDVYCSSRPGAVIRPGKYEGEGAEAVEAALGALRLDGGIVPFVVGSFILPVPNL